MSKLEELIERLCPNEVEEYILNEVCSFQNGFSFKSNLFRSEGERILRITNINDGKILDDNCVFFNINDYKENLEAYKVYKGDVVVAMSGATTGKIGCNYSDTIYYLNQRVGLFRPNENKLNKRYLYHWLLSKSNEIYNISSGTGAQPNLSSIKMMNFKIAVPPLEVQCEIVSILDNFTLLSVELSAELSAELKARQKQYEYYQNKLLKIEGQNYKLGEIAEFKTGVKPKEILEEGKFEYINAGTTNSGYSEKNNFKGDVVTTPSRGQGGIGFVGYQKNDFWLGPLCYAIWSKNEEILMNKYLYYELSSKKDEILKRKNIGGVPALNGCDLKTIPIKIPSIEKQKKIVSILDKFQEITEDIWKGIPAEIEARQKQYEYYRNKLMTFKEVNKDG